VSDLRDALLYLDLDKGPDAPGPLFEEPRRLLDSDPHLRAGWFQYQALRALALESAPEPGERMLRAVLMQCRRERVGRQLARTTGGEDEARSILLGKLSEGRAFPGWILCLLLLGTLGLGAMAFHDDWLGKGAADAAGPAAAPFEFPAQTPPAEAAVSNPPQEPGTDGDESDADDTHTEVPAARQARQILRAHLQEAHARQAQAEPAQDTDTEAASAAAGLAQATLLPAVEPSPASAPQAPPLAPPAEQPVPQAAEQPVQNAPQEAAVPAGLTLSSNALGGDNASLDILLGLPERRDIDLRLFDANGRTVRVLAMGAFGPGTQHFPMDAKNDNGERLGPGNYYLRVMTPWFSRVEPIQIQ
jgi:FlgD Ig-like domain